MTITISGTTGIAGVDGSAGTPAVQGADTNTGIFFPAADTIAFGEGGTEVMRIDSSGNVGIGTSLPARKFEVIANSAPAAQFVRTTTATNTVQTNPVVIARTSGNMADGFGTLVNHQIQDDAGVDNTIGYYGFVRNGADNSGAFYVSTSNAGTVAERVRITASGNVGIGMDNPVAKLQIASTNVSPTGVSAGSIRVYETTNDYGLNIGGTGTVGYIQGIRGVTGTTSYNDIALNPNGGGRVLVGGTTTEPETNSGTDGIALSGTSGAYAQFAVISKAVAAFNRMTTDGTIVSLRQAGTEEGTISVSGTTVSYNGGNLSRWAQMPGTKDDTLVKGTVMSNLDEMNVYTDAEGNPVDNEQLNKVKVSDVEGDVNVAGVFVNWTYDEAHQVDEINMAMTGDMIIRIAQGVVVQKGDLLMSAGDGTAKPQGDDIVRSKTVAKVTSNHVTCTYADGSYCVPCVLMAC